ncbi:MAG: hypothetical protein H0X24_00570 [Ktedonobacterales bacterium]|nr:hypothetical protein [Ktedonobacterales bacterium]
MMPPIPPPEETPGEAELLALLRVLDAQGGAMPGDHARYTADRLPLIMANLPVGLSWPAVLDWLLTRFQTGQGLP